MLNSIEIDTIIKKETISQLPTDVYTDIVESIDQIELLGNLLDPNRLRAHNIPKDTKGRIIVDITKPHILEDTDYFRPLAIYYQKHGRYTDIFPNPSPNSDYRRFWEEQRRRCIDGYVRESDGDWISGYYYFYLNFSPILRTVIVEDNESKSETVRSERIYDFPDFWDGDYMFFHYVEQGERDGEYGNVLKTRGRGFSFKVGSMFARNYFFFEKSRSYAMASETEFLIKDGILNKAWDVLDWVDENTPYTKAREKKDQDMHKRASYIDRVDKLEKGFKSEIIGVTLKDNPQKAHPYSTKIVTPIGIKLWKDIIVGSQIFGNTGLPINVTEIHEFPESDIYTITFNDGRMVQASANHEWDVVLWKSKTGTREMNLIEKTLETKDLIPILNLRSTSSARSIKIKVNNLIYFDKQDIPIDAYFLGLMLGDGSFGKANDIQSHLTMKHDDINDIKYNIPFNIRQEKYSDIRNVVFVPNGRTIYKELDLFDKRSGTKFIPDMYKYNTEQIRFDIINGLLDTDGSVTKDFGVIEYSTKSNRMANDFIWIIRSLGIGCKLTSKITNGEIYYRCYVYCEPNETRLFNLKRKKELISRKKYNSYANNKRKYITITSIELTSKEPCKCVTVDAEDSLYLIEDFIVTRNSRGKRAKLIGWEESGVFPGLSTAWSIARMSLEDGRRVFGYMCAFGTGGTTGANFDSAIKFFYNPDGYRIKKLRNIYDKTRGNGECSFFFPEYLNRADCYDKEGNSLVMKALVEIFMDRKKIREGTTDPHALTQEKADRPITPEEAVMRKDGTLFPVSDLKDIRATIVPQLDKFVSGHYVGDLIINSEGLVKWQPNPSLRVVREFPIKDNLNKIGALEMFELPNDYKPRGRYIAGIDPVDDDHSTTNSLCSMFIFDTFTDRIVAEYTGRPMFANDFYELALRTLKYYNALGNYENDKKGLYSYFSQRGALYLLCDNPKILSDKDMVKGENYGNKKKGTPSGVRTNQWGRRLQRDWMLSKAIGEDESELLNLHKIRSIGYLDECIEWNSDGNFDRVSAMGMCMILREEIRKYSDSMKETEIITKPSFSNSLKEMVQKDISYNMGTIPKFLS